MQLERFLAARGFGTRRECAALVVQGRVAIDGTVQRDPRQPLALLPDAVEVDGVRWPVPAAAWLMLHKPPGAECSRAPRDHVPVLSLLPPPLQRRGVQPVGRLDADTTGLLLLSDDGALAHRLTSPRRHVEKVYEVTCRHAVDAPQCRALLDGVVLHDDPVPVRALACEATGPMNLRLTIAEGRYHQVRRMLGAAGNRVEALHRSRFGPLALPSSLAPGQWRWLDTDEVAALRAAVGATAPPHAGLSASTPA